MSPSAIRRFVVADGAGLDQLIAGLAKLPHLQHDREVAVARTVLDTFDWRLFAEGTVLEHRVGTVLEHRVGTVLEHRVGTVLEAGRDAEAGGDRVLVWRSLGTGEPLGRIPCAEPPRFASDLPPGPVASRLADVVDVRALLALAVIDSRVTVLRQVDDEGKTVARVVVDRSSLVDGTDLPGVVEVVPVKGYQRHARRLGDLLAAQLVLGPGEQDVATAALAAAGFRPGDYSSKLRLALDPGADALDAWVTVLHALARTMVRNEEGVRADVDSEFLHDYRVAVRRTRSVLGQARAVLPADALDRFLPGMAWLGQLTGPTRDLDVYLLALPDFEAGLPPERRADLAPVAAFLARRQREAHAELTAGLDSDRYRELMAGWTAWLDEPPPASEAGPKAGRAAPEVAAARIVKAHHRLVADGRAIGRHSPPEDLHRLRKDAKKLRYLLECFGSLFPAELVRPVVKELKALQDVLGEYQDCQVQADALTDLGERMLAEGDVPAATLMAMGSMVDRLDEREAVARREFGPSFARFDHPAVRRAVRSLAEARGAPRPDQPGGDG